jgi:hypothetical protein
MIRAYKDQYGIEQNFGFLKNTLCGYLVIYVIPLSKELQNIGFCGLSLS